VLTAIRLLRQAANWVYLPVGAEAWVQRRLCTV
jgi:hypothetical protein